MAPQTKYHKVTFLPENKTIEVADRITIFETILENNPQNIQLRFACGAEGICQKCKVRAFQKMGPLTPTERGCLSEEELGRGIRLACQARVIQDTQVEIIYKMPFSIRLIDEAIDGVALDPRIQKMYLRSPADHPFSAELLLEGLRGSGVPEGALETIARHVREKFSGIPGKNMHDCTAVLIEDDLACIEEGNTAEQKYAVAVDLGVNTIVASLVDLHRGRKIAVVTDTNPQIHLAGNYEQRVSLIEENPLNLEILNEEILLRIDILVLELCRACAVMPLHVYEIVVSGGTGMLHLFLKGIAGLMEQQPSCATAGAPSFSAEQFDFKSSQQARIYTLPVIGAYAGADITAGILATQLHRSAETALLLDLGTDIKAVLHHRGEITAASIPGSGVFDGVGIRCGMRPETGAIEQVTIDAAVHTRVIGESLARGICGSGLMELAAALKRVGIIDERGNFHDASLSGSGAPAVTQALCTIDGSPAFRLYSDAGEFQTDIHVTREDIFLLRQAKAGVTLLIQDLLGCNGLVLADVARVLISGAFGSAIDIDAFFELGFFPACFKGKVLFVGNTSKKGAQMVLLDRSLLEEAENIVKDVVCIPLTHHEPSEDELHFLPVF